MNLNEYLIENDRHIGDVVILNSVGTALDKVSGDTFPMMVDNTIGVDEPMNIMEMEINGDSYEWFESLSDTDKESVDDVMFNLSYEDWVDGHIGEPEYLGNR
jgi:metallophosphoesterase superfamily enzyme